MPAREEASTHRLRYVATQRQLGPVAYRDPIGAISPDGAWLATTAGLHLYLRRVDGGGVRELGTGTHRVTDLAWLPDAERLAARELNFERTTGGWLVYDVTSGDREPLWAGVDQIRGRPLSRDGDTTGEEVAVAIELFVQLSFSPDGERAAAVTRDGTDARLWVLRPNGSEARSRLVEGGVYWPTWLPDGRLACILEAGGARNIVLDCLASDLDPTDDAIASGAYGALAAGPGGELYYGLLNERGTLDLWRRMPSGERERLTRFARDTYGPTATTDGRVLFQTQEYRTTIAAMPASGGESRALTTFQSETPSWDRDGRRIAFTFGSWRRKADDAHYPDISQNLGVAPVGAAPAGVVETVIRATYSEDQGMDFSPNGRWIVLHSHAEATDDVWLQPADGSRAAWPISTGGHETGWPRFSPDGRWICYTTDVRSADETRLGVLQVIGIDPETGDVTSPQREVDLQRFRGQLTFAEFLPDSRRLVFEAIHGPRQRGIWVVDADGGVPRPVHRFESEQWFSGISLSPDARWVSFIAPASDGLLQVFRVPLAGGAPGQLTFDATDKTQPSYSPDGERLAFTVFRYRSLFWLLEPGVASR